MKIKRLEIIGFKSFFDKAVLEFPEGVTAVVGPNGCGKSNVVDAIRWVMGEQSAKNLRGKQMEDIIFGGSETRKPLGMAEVSLVFSTEDGRVPAKYLTYSEIQVTRRLYRDGESEYFLNKTPCRLLDISELFMDTGVGARAYSIIEQGRIGMILLAKPEDRRFLIEEAAGVTKYKARKQVAMKKIDATRQNLVRIADIIAEIKRQLNSLQRQAKKAERFRACREELKEIELALAARQHHLLEEERQRVSSELTQAESRVAVLAAELEQGEVSLEERRVTLLEDERGVTASQEEIYRFKSDFQGCENRLEFQRKELLNLERHIARFSEELVLLERQSVEAETELKLLEERRTEFLAETVDEDRNLALRDGELAELVATEKLLSQRLEEKRKSLFALLADIARHNNQQSSAAKRLSSLTERFERNRRESLAQRERLVQSQQRVGELEAGRVRQVELKASLAEELSVTKTREAGLREELALKERAFHQNRDELNRKASRLHSLQELEAQFAGYGQGVRALFLADDHKARFRGLVADVVETDEEYEAALEAVLGDRLQFILGGRDEDVWGAVGFLKEKGGGRCSFLPAGLVPRGPGAVPPGALPLLQQVRISSEFRGVVDSLLSSTYVVPELPRALELSRRHPELTFVTSEGDLAYGGGIVSGGSTEGAGQGLIHKKREIKELSREVALLTAQVQELEALRSRLKSDVASTEESLRELRGRQHQAEIQLLNHEKDLQRVREECLRLDERLAVNDLEYEQLCEEKAGLEQEIAGSLAGKEAAEEGQRALEAELEEMNAGLTGKRREIEAAREQLTALKVRVASLNEKREANVRAGKRVTELLRELSGRTAGHRVELEKSSHERERLQEALAVSDAQLRDLTLRMGGAEQSYLVVRERYDAAASLVREEESRLKRIRGEVEAARQAVAAQSLKLSQTVLALHHLEDTLREKYRLELVELLPRFNAEGGDEHAPVARQAELQRQIDEMGEVNLTAIEEYRELEERFTFLSEQRADLEESLASLQQAIQRINRTTRKRFQETFLQVNAKFQEVFPRLFCGGRAELRLTDEDNLLESGIEIVVQPPGKKLQNVTLLSGGEKALTAVALIFSIFLIKPSPFCLLDEVDAPLDDANISRFNEMIREMTAFSQFILITHSKTTMAVADTLYGVTMEEPGVSKLVSVRLN